MRRLIIALLRLHFCLIFAMYFEGEAKPDTNYSTAGNITHSFANQQMRIRPTQVYDRAVTSLMLEEINRTARDLNLSESLPLELTNAAIFIDTPAYFIHSKTLGTVDTRNYVYNFSAGKTVSGVDHKHVAATWEDFRSRYTWPISQLDTNKALKTAMQIMSAAGMDINALNRDCIVDIKASVEAGASPQHFVPHYFVNWDIINTNTLFDDLPDSTEADSKREDWGSRAALLQFLEPTKEIQSLQVFDPKYIAKKPLKDVDLIGPLMQGNSRESVLAEIEIATNIVKRRELLISQGYNESWLESMGLGKSILTNSAKALPAKPNN